MLMFRLICSAFLIVFSIFLMPGSVFAAILAEQTTEYSHQLNVWQVVQELGDNLSGPPGTFTFRVKTSEAAISQQFDYTAQNTHIYDKETETIVAFGCATGNPSDRLRGLTFNTQGVPPGYTDVTIDFSCTNSQFIPGHKYLIKITNANICNGCIKFAAAAYGGSGIDYFTPGGLRYGNGNIFDFFHGSGSCHPDRYIWGDPTVNPVSGCYIWTSPKDDLYFILTNTTPESTPTPTPTPSPTPFPSPTPTPSKTPLILIPGIGGSELKVAEDTFWLKEDGHGGIFNHAYSNGEKVWVNEGEAAKPGDDDYFDILRMKSDGVTPEANLELTGNLFAGAYQPTIDFFVSNGYELNKTLFVFPYDWRKDISLTALLLDQKINEIKNQTGSEKVDVVSHSMGGLVARNYIADANRAQNVRKLFTLGTPHLGAENTFLTLLYGTCLSKPGIPTFPVCFGVSPSETKDVIQNMLGAYQIAPTQEYFTFYSGSDNSHPVPFNDSSDVDNNGVMGALNYAQTKELLTNLGYNTSLYSSSETFHALDNAIDITNGVDVIILAGSGIDTVGQIIEKNIINFAGIKIPKKDIIIINGDDTVPLFSASLEDKENNLSIKGAAKNYYIKQNHSNLAINNTSLIFVRNILNDDNTIPTGISTEPFKLKGAQLSVHSPINIHVYDTNGNHTGPTSDGNYETNIPGSSYNTLDDAKFIWLPDEGVYNIVFEATGEGSFDFKIRNFENDLNTQTILYEDIPLEETSSGQTVFDTSREPPVLEVDNTNYTYFSILDGNANYDHTAPVISFDSSTNILWPPNGKLVDVNISGNIQDENLFLVKVQVDDEYDLIEPTIETYYQTSYNQNVQLQASRRGDDLDGRTYTITIIIKDLAGNEAQQQLEVVVPHDQR